MFIKENTPGRKKVYEQKNAIQKDCTLGNYYISDEKYKTMKSFIAEPGDIIVSCAGTIGEIYILPEEAETGVINQALMRIKLFRREIEKYFILYFDSVLKKEANEKGNGTGMKNIPPFDVLKKMLLPLPPEQEIKRILDKIETINSKISIIANSFKSLFDYVQSAKSKILNSIFEQNSSYKSYYEKPKLNTLCRLSNGDYSEGQELPYLEAKVIRGSKQPKVVKSGIKISKGTTIILVDGENSGEVMTAPFDGYMGSTFRILEINASKITKDYLLLFLLLNKQRFKDNKKGSAIPHLNKKLFNELTIILPDKVKQKMIVEYASKVFANLDNIID